MQDATNRAIEVALRAQHSLGIKGDNKDNYVIARETFLSELGLHGPRQQEYAFDDATRDVLIAHSRQDVAHALLNTTSLLKRVEDLQKQVRGLSWSLLMLAVLIAVFRYF